MIANLTSFSSAAPPGWVRDDTGKAIHCYPVDNYLDERAEWFERNGVRINSWHRPLSTYMRLLLAQCLRLTFFDEPAAIGNNDERAIQVRRRRGQWSWNGARTNRRPYVRICEFPGPTRYERESSVPPAKVHSTPDKRRFRRGPKLPALCHLPTKANAARLASLPTARHPRIAGASGIRLA